MFCKLRILMFWNKSNVKSRGSKNHDLKFSSRFSIINNNARGSVNKSPRIHLSHGTQMLIKNEKSIVNKFSFQHNTMNFSWNLRNFWVIYSGAMENLEHLQNLTEPKRLCYIYFIIHIKCMFEMVDVSERINTPFWTLAGKV